MTGQDLSQTVALLSRTPAVLDVLLRDLPDIWTHRNEGGDSWNAFAIVGHLIHGERTDWMPRVHLLLEFGETRPFVQLPVANHLQVSPGYFRALRLPLVALPSP